MSPSNRGTMLLIAKRMPACVCNRLLSSTLRQNYLLRMMKLILASTGVYTTLGLSYNS